MATVDVLGALMVLRVVGQVDCGFVVHGERSGRVARIPEVCEESSKVDGLLGGLAGRNDLGLARRKGYGGLFLRRPGDRGAVIGEVLIDYLQTRKLL
eukprot:13306-Pleurochrysis_carterae.AAC.1